ncbi:MAG: pentapeptide repeat-containing protein [Lachnospiraceae bacterium]|nr:pentapeptide repeat-containing protein [Lachnospiraceae bacterium]
MRIINTIFEKDIDLSIFQPYKINCEKCCGLCCVALCFTKSDGFPKDKKAGEVCENLQVNYKCKIHSKLSRQGLKGCVVYDCFGAGQFITRHLKLSHEWKSLLPKETEKIINSYLVVLRTHQTLWYLSQCLILRLPQSEKEQAKFLINEGSTLIEKPIEMLAVLDTKLFCEKSNAYLKRICTVFQTHSYSANKIQGKNYMGKNMKHKNLEKMDFSMSLLIATNLEQANLCGANFLGADMRDTNISNTDLSQCLFLTQLQINSAKGNSNTSLPSYLYKPKTWD